MNKQMSLQWRLTLMTALLVTAACLLLNFFVGTFAAYRMDEIGDSVVRQFSAEADADADARIVMQGDFYIDITGPIQDNKTGFRVESILATLLIAIAVSGITYFTVGRALRPLKALEAQTAAIRADNLGGSIDIRSNAKEITSLTAAFNHMLCRLNENFSVLRQFSANAAHELRTPLTVMQTKIEVLQKRENPTTEEYAETLGAVRQQTQRLSHVVNVLLEMTELHSAELTQNVSLAEIAEEVLCDLTDLSQSKEIVLQQNGGDASVCGSDLLLYRAVYNLVENAIKYNRCGGSVTVDITAVDGWAEICVEDTGIGIAEADFPKIFEPFFRVDKSRSREMGGAGLGLALVGDIAARHGGRVYVKRSSSEGTVMALRLPLRAEA